MAKKKVYAVRKGRKTGLFYTWDECKAAIEGYSGAVFRGFLTEEEAKVYLMGCAESEGTDTKKAACGNAVTEECATEKAAYGEAVTEEYATEKLAYGKCVSEKQMSEDSEIPEPGQIIAYVDGSFEVSLGRYAYGCVILTPEGEIIRKSGSGNNPESAALRIVTGEMLGSMNAVKWCIEHGYSAVDIRYDYMGIEMWATGGWKAKNELTQKYAEYMQRNAQRMKITFRKIAAHTGNKYNEEADKLAKAALEQEE